MLQVSALCYRMLHLLSGNDYVVAEMAKDPSFQATLVADLARQLFRRKVAHEKHLAEIRQKSDWNAAPVTIWATETETGASFEPAVEVDQKGADTLFFCALNVLKRVLQAINWRVGAGTDEQRERALTLPEPLHFLYRKNHYQEISSGKGASGLSSNPLNCDLVADIAELLVTPHEPASERVSARLEHIYIWPHQTRIMVGCMPHRSSTFCPAEMLTPKSYEVLISRGVPVFRDNKHTILLV